MPQIIVIADTPGETDAAQVMFRERVTKRDFDSGHFAAQLAERLGWAVGDAHAVEHNTQARRIEAAASTLRGALAETTSATDQGVSAETSPTNHGVSAETSTTDDDVSAETPQRRSARVVTTAS
jgi:hypothetical protein